MKLSHSPCILLLGVFLLTPVAGESQQLRRRLSPQTRQTKPCILTERSLHFENHLDSGKWLCELVGEDAEQSGQSFVQIEGLGDEDFQLARSGSTTLYAEGATIVNGTLLVPPDAKKELGTAEPRGPAATGVAQLLELQQVPVNATMHDRRNLEPIVLPRKVLVVRVVGNDVSTTSSLDVLRDKIFGDSNDQVNLKERMASCSYGELLMGAYSGTTTTGVTIPNGVIEVRVDSDFVGKWNNVSHALVKDALEKVVGSLPNQFDHVMMCLPYGTIDPDYTQNQESWIAYGSWLSVYNDLRCNAAMIQVHEVGHNLGLHHASETEKTPQDTEYGDDTGSMGNGNESDDARLCYNPAKSWQLGWYSLRRIEWDVVTMGNFSGQLIGINDYKHPNAAGKYINVKIDHPGSNDEYYVGFNLAQGINNDTAEAQNLVTVHRQPGYGKSWLLAKLGGEHMMYTISNFVGTRTLVIEVKSIDLLATPPVANVEIFMPPPLLCETSNDCIEVGTCSVGTCLPNGVCSYDRQSNCPGIFHLALHTDDYPEQISWNVFDVCKNAIVATGGGYKTPYVDIEFTKTLGQSQYRFDMNDSGGNGLHGGKSDKPTNFTITFDGFHVRTILDNFGPKVSIPFGLPDCSGTNPNDTPSPQGSPGTPSPVPPGTPSPGTPSPVPPGTPSPGTPPPTPAATLPNIAAAISVTAKKVPKNVKKAKKNAKRRRRRG